MYEQQTQKGVANAYALVETQYVSIDLTFKKIIIIKKKLTSFGHCGVLIERSKWTNEQQTRERENNVPANEIT